MSRYARLAAISPPCPMGNAEVNPVSPNYSEEAAKQYINFHVDLFLHYIRLAAQREADLIVSPETIDNIGCFCTVETWDSWKTLVDQYYPVIMRCCQELAAEFRTNLAIDITEPGDDTCYNCATLIGRDGEVIGKYHKVHIPPQERFTTSAGDGFPVFRTDIGTVGMAICYDSLFPEAFRCLALNGADIIAHMGGVDDQLASVRSRENVLFTVYASSHAGIATPTGEIIALSSIWNDYTASAVVDLDVRPPLPPDNAWASNTEIRKRRADERVPAAYGPLAAERVPVQDKFADDRTALSRKELTSVYRKLEQQSTRAAKRQMVEDREEHRDLKDILKGARDSFGIPAAFKPPG